MIISTLSGILAADYDDYSKMVAKILLDEVSRKLSLKYKSITNNSLNFNSEIDFVKTITNHPVHIVDLKGKISPSAFIPFCQFGVTEISSIGLNIDEFSIPVCNIFRETILVDQLCYQANIKDYLLEPNSEDFKTGFTFLVDNNLDRQIATTKENSVLLDNNPNLSEFKTVSLIYINIKNLTKILFLQLK